MRQLLLQTFNFIVVNAAQRGDVCQGVLIVLRQALQLLLGISGRRCSVLLRLPFLQETNERSLRCVKEKATKSTK